MVGLGKCADRSLYVLTWNQFRNRQYNLLVGRQTESSAYIRFVNIDGSNRIRIHANAWYIMDIWVMKPSFRRLIILLI